MQINPSTDNERSRFADTSISYGWVSIVLHWLTATVVIALWFLGQSIDSAEAGTVATRFAYYGDSVQVTRKSVG